MVTVARSVSSPVPCTYQVLNENLLDVYNMYNMWRNSEVRRNLKHLRVCMEAGVGEHRVRGGEVHNRDVEVSLVSVAMGRIWGSVLRTVGNN